MLFYIGVMLALAGVWMIIRIYVLSRRPKIYDARIRDIFKDYYVHPKHPDRPSPRKLLHANVEYFYQSIRYESRLLLKSKQARPGDVITVTVDPRKPGLAEHYRPGSEFMVALLLCAIGTGIVIFCIIAKDSLT